jgi:hypothetical protein
MIRGTILFSVFLAIWGCSNNSSDGDDENGGNDGDSDSDTDTDVDSDTDSDTDGDVDTDTDVDTDVDTDADGDTGYGTDYEQLKDGGAECGEWDLKINMNPARLMLLQDLSSSMNEGNPPKWEQARNALISLVNTFGFNEMLELGLDVFPDRRNCYANEPLVIDAAPANGQAIYDILMRLSLSQSTPLYMAMQNFLDPDYAPVFSGQDLAHYLVVISDGKDSCGQEPGSSPSENSGATARQLGTLTAELLDTHDIMTIAIGFGSDADPEQLNAIASAGGTPYSTYFQAGDRAELEDAFNQIAAFAINCEFQIDPQQSTVDDMTIDMDQVNFYFDGEIVGLDKGCEVGGGWDWTNSTVRDAVKFCDEACEKIKSGEVTDISATFGCESKTILVVK